MNDSGLTTLLAATDRLASAAVAWHEKCDAVDQAHAAIASALPADPPRGSYDWWTKFARENTGQSLCDSGIAYGYTYNRAVMPADVLSYARLYKGQLDGFSINTVAWLVEATDANDPAAIALEKAFHYLAETPDYRRKSWFSVLAEFVPWLLRFLEAPAPDVLSAAEVELLRTEIDSRCSLSGDHTCNHDVGLDQDFSYEVFSLERDIYADSLAVISLHTGCDIRGGYARPAFVRIDPDRFYAYCLDFYCQECEMTWEDHYDLARSFGDGRKLTIRVADQPVPSDASGWRRADDVTLSCPRCGNIAVVTGYPF